MAVENNRIKILETSLRLFSEKGYNAVGVQEIADECSLTKPALYYYFNSKAGILEGIMTEYVDPFVNVLEQKASYNGDVEGTLKAVAYYYVESGCKNMPLFMMMMSMQYAPPKSEFYKAFYNHCGKVFDTVISIFENAKDKLGNMNGRQQQFALTFLGMLGFHMYILRNNDNPRVNTKDIDMLIHQFLHGIYS